MAAEKSYTALYLNEYMKKFTKKIILCLLSIAAGLNAEAALAFQSAQLDCGFKFILPPLGLAVIFGLAAFVMTIVILADHKKSKVKRLVLWWIIPISAFIMVVIASNIC